MKRLKQNELKEWCEKELGDGYTVEIANKNNAGDGYDTAVVVTKNNENATKSSVPELGQPTHKGASMANVGANVQIKVERTKRLEELSEKIDKEGRLGAHQLLHEIDVAFDTSMTKEEGAIKSTAKSEYYAVNGTDSEAFKTEWGTDFGL